MPNPRYPTYVEMSNAIRAAVAAAAAGLPVGGTAGQVLTKLSAVDGDADWQAVPPAANGMPVGGAAFQSLVKSSATDYDVAWGNPTAPNGLPTGGTAGQVLTKSSATNYDAAWSTGGLVPSGTALQILASSGGTASVWTNFANYSCITKGARDTTVRTSTSNTTLTATGLTFTVTSGTMYALKAWGTFRTAAITTGLALGFSTTVATTYCGWGVQIEQAAAGTDQNYTANALTLGTVLVSTGVVAANTDYLWEIEGRFQPSADGTVTIGFRSEVSASQVTWQAGAAATLTAVA